MTSQKAAVHPSPLASKRAMVSVLSDLEQLKADMPKKGLLDDSTLITTELSDSDSLNDQLSESSLSLHSILSDDTEDCQREQGSRKKSVRFSDVSIREYAVIEELRALSGDLEGFLMPVRTLSWEYSHLKTLNIDSHQRESKREKIAPSTMLIDDRQVHSKEEKEEKDGALKKSTKSKGIKRKMMKLLKEIGRGFSDVSGCSQ